MAQRVLGPTGSPRRRWTLLLPLVAVIALGLFHIAGAQATHDLEFQLDGDPSTACGTVPACVDQTLDWDSIFNANTTPKSPLPADFANATFSRDFGLKDPGRNDCSLTSTDTTKPFCTADSTTFATGSKDTLNISGWQCNQDNNVNSKIDIMNAYAVAHTASDGDRLLYFGLEKNKDNGTNNVGFWFLQGNANCTSTGQAVTWSGLHQDGDVLVVSEFTSGGGVSNITAYKWQGTANPANPLVSFGSGGDCKTTTVPPSDVLCATTNSGANAFNGNIQTSWLTSDATLGVGNTVVPPDFFEGAINLTEAFRGSGSPAPSCFNTFIADTRSSKETSATLFDYARGTLGQCGLTLTTAPSLGSGGSTTLAATTAVTDTATIAGTSGAGGTAPSPTGTVNFFLCSPSQLTTGGSADPVTGVCESGGTAPPTGNQNPVQVTPGTAPNSTAVSGNVRSLLTAAGRYCFRAVFTAAANDPNYAGQTANTSNPTGECFTVTGTSSSSSAQRWLPNDRITLTGDSNLNGTLTVTLYSGTFSGTGANCSAGSATAVTGQSYSFTVTNGAKTGVSFNTTNTDPATAPNTTFYVGTKSDGTAGGAAGTYFWLVDYDDNTLTDPPDRCETSTVTITD